MSYNYNKSKSNKINSNSFNKIWPRKNFINTIKLWPYNKKNKSTKYMIFFFKLLFLFIFIFYILNDKNIFSFIIYKKDNIFHHILTTNINSTNKSINKVKSFFFLEKNLKNCTNFGIFIYDYSFDKKKHLIGNIGDYIQSLAALQFLPKKCIPIFIDRDSIEIYNGEKINLIMNGWYQITKGNRFISSNISPIYSSIHINNPNKIDSFVINNLKKYEPIGCRDIYTLNILQKLRIKSYFSSCLTTTLDIDYMINESERSNEIIFIDYNFGYNKQIDNYIKSLKTYNFHKVSYTSHYFNMKLSQFERFKLAKSLLDKYARAKLIITTRLHGALPCLALNTPFIFVNRKYDVRYDGLYELINHVGINSTGKFDINVLLNKNKLVINPKKYLKYSNQLKKKLLNITNQNY